MQKLFLSITGLFFNFTVITYLCFKYTIIILS